MRGRHNQQSHGRRGGGGGGGGGGRDPISQKYFNDDFQVDISRDARNQLRNIFGRALTNEEIGRLAGAPDGTIIHGDIGPNGEDVTLFVEGGKHGSYFDALRTISRGLDGRPIIHNEYLDIEPRGEGIGARSFATQVSTGIKLGVARILTHAAGLGLAEVAGVLPPGVPPPLNGHYTWARLGYNGIITDRAYDNMRRFGLTQPKPVFVHDIWKLEPSSVWRERWRDYGDGFDGWFELSENSQSVVILRDYMKEKGIRL